MRKVATAITAMILFVVTGSVPANAMLPREDTRYHDYCPTGTVNSGDGFYVECDDDYPCELLVTLTYSGECYWRFGA